MSGDQDIIDTIDVSLREHMTPGAPSDGSYCCAWAVLAALRERYAIVELPKAGDDERWDIPSCGEFNGVQSMGDSCTSVEITEEGIDVDVFGPQTPLEARLLAAVLLAAADLAEEGK